MLWKNHVFSGSIHEDRLSDDIWTNPCGFPSTVHPGSNLHIIQAVFVDRSKWIVEHDPLGLHQFIIQLDDAHDPTKQRKSTKSSAGSALWIDPSYTYGHIHMDGPWNRSHLCGMCVEWEFLLLFNRDKVEAETKCAHSECAHSECAHSECAHSEYTQ